MKPKLASKKRWIVALVVLTLFFLTAAPVLAWWSDWYTPSFVASYSPSSYKHGQWDSDVGGGTEAFGSKMKWNQTRADGVRNYSNNKHYIPWCGLCYAYYTHDHTDMNNKLHGWALGSNMPNPKYDWDDDNGNGWYEEGEVVSVNNDFPTTNYEYSFATYYKRQASGIGDLYETPAVSAKPWWSSEYETWLYDNHESLAYYTYGSYASGPQPGEAPVGIPYSTTLSIGQFPVHIWGIEGARTINVGLGYSLQDSNELTAYADWARTHLGSELRKAGVKQALTVVTFNQPILPELLDRLLRQADKSSVEIVKAVYLDANDPDPGTNVWTLQTRVEEGSDYAKSLGELVDDIAVNGFDDDGGRPNLEMQGIVAITVWLPLDTVDFLNTHKLVYLADASPSYLRLVASDTKEAERVRTSVEEVELLRDGLASFIRPSFNDVYPELQLFLTDKR